MPRPREYDDDLRVRLLEASARLLADEGPTSMTTRRIASEVGTSTTAIYSLIGAKDDVVRAMYREGFRRLAVALAEVEPSDDPVTDLTRLGHAYFAMGMASPHFYALMFACPVPLDALRDDAAADDITFALSTFEVLVDAVARCVDAGRFAGDPREIARQLWSLEHGVTSLALAGMLGTPEEAGATLAAASAAVVAGLAVTTTRA